MSEAAETENPARYALFKALFLRSEGRTQAEAHQLIDDYAHELAETIRKQTARRNLIRPEFEEAWEAGLDRAADLIEPRNEDGELKASAGPVRPDEEPTT